MLLKTARETSAREARGAALLRPPGRARKPRIGTGFMRMANPCTKILDFRGFDSSIILISRGGIPRPIGNFPEISSQRILVGRLGVRYLAEWVPSPPGKHALQNCEQAPASPFHDPCLDARRSAPA